MDTLHWILTSADFRVYSKQEILELSVKEIVSPQTFDLLQNAVIGGLHDPALGPSRRDDRCETCGQSERNCAGHFGHIKLPVLVFNPMFFKILLKLLQGSCMGCHKLGLRNAHMKLYTYQLKLLEKGFLVQAEDMIERFLNSELAEDVIIQEMNDYYTNVLQGDKDESVLSKNIITFRHQTVAMILRMLAKTKSICLHCHTKNRSLKAEYNQTIVGTMSDDRSSKKRVIAKKVDDNNLGTETAVDDAVEMDNQQSSPNSNETLGPDVTSSPMDDQLQLELENFLKSKHKRCILSPNIAREHIKMVWDNSKDFLKQLFPFLATVKKADCPTDVFFLDVLPVPPSRFRPLSVMKERKYEHPQTANLSNIIKECVTLRDLLQLYNKRLEAGGNVLGLTLPETAESVAINIQKIMASWLRLQSKVNVVLDSDLDKLSQDKSIGIKQLLEKKQGLFRMHMMGKRVNYAARSVISPDPYISTNEIGIPMVFASKLTYPQRVTPWNIHQLRQLVINGPDIYPGAVSVVSEDGTVVKLNPSNASQREAVAKQLLVPDKNVSGSKIVNRHLINGDYLILNRQPTLHKPSMQVHKARVLPSIKTLRMHYSNCKAYNADFDGDEMNAHFPQCERSRAEAACIACTDYQYLVPKDSTPLAGLIQDHMVSGVALTIRGRFFTRAEYCGLVWSAMNDWKEKIDILPPTILKPTPLWSGKQIISTILINLIPKGKGLINLSGKAKIPEKSWLPWTSKVNMPLNMAALETEALGESTVIIRQGELLQGVLDKAHYGPSSYGLVHCCYELYGGEMAGKFLTYLGRLFTSFLQMVGFSLGVGDILVQRRANKRRKDFIKKSLHIGKNAVLKALNLNPETTTETDLLLELKEAHFDKTGMKMAELDMCMKSETDKIQDNIAKAIMPGRLEKGFPANSLQLMVQSGAKGSPVNCMQISCLLGQIELEGRRPPLMMSGRSLPSFLPYDFAPKAGGFITGRFLTGIRPQEYFFHCMAGREGLIDTAVKTSRSGYLQRCLVKHLEGLMVNYDCTVRDSDGGVIQFYYGEDGLEPMRSTFLQASQFPFLTENLHVLLSTSHNPWHNSGQNKNISRTWKRISKWRSHTTQEGHWYNRDSSFLKFCNSQTESLTQEDRETIVRTGQCLGRSLASQKLCSAWAALEEEEKGRMTPRVSSPDPLMSRFFPHSYPDVLSEKFRHQLNVYCKKSFKKVTAKMSQNCSADVFMSAINKKFVQCMAHPGEAVGLGCAQSIGEPSTQMTLNTFHFAGRGEMNVTLGIPRLREILMTASANIKTPSMDVPVIPVPDFKEKAEWLQKHLNRVTMDKVVQKVKVKVYSQCGTESGNRGSYKYFEVKIKFLPRRDFESLTNLTYKEIMKYVVKQFLVNVDTNIKKENIIIERTTLLSTGRVNRSTAENKEDTAAENPPDENEDDDIEVEANDGDAAAVKEQQRQTDTQEYIGEEEEQQEVSFNDGSDDDEDDAEESENDNTNEQEADIQEHKNLVKQATSYSFVKDFKFDKKKRRWCTITFMYEQSHLQLDIRMLLDRTIKSVVLHQVKGITRAFLTEEKENGETVVHLKTEGVNMQELFKYPDILDLNQLYSNCVHTMANTYGIEAANRVIIKEIQNVFGAYGILVDYHHLSLLADFMTTRGTYDAFNRRDIHFNTSPLQKMTFETTMNFLLDACLSGSKDSLKSPSSSLVVGNVVGVGTGCFEILDPLQ
ncbi:DNA-directed RNA polymerase I subunit RPA1 [Biomphalaria glabrata]|nr:DNA-directed RNA polymerase I subunit RPA1 [Biomphalaria glabrata]